MPSKPSNKGWFRVYRQIFEWRFSPTIEKRPFTRFEAWIWLFGQANHQGRMVRDVVVNRGEILTSLSQLGDAWRWDRTKVRRFLVTLQKSYLSAENEEFGHEIDTRVVHQATQITIRNYPTYQGDRHNDDTASETKVPQQLHQQLTQQTHTNNTLKKDKKDKKAAGGDHKDFHKLRERLQMDPHLSTMIGGLVPRDYLNGLLAEFDYNRIDTVATELSEYVSGLRYKPTAIKLMEWLPDRCRRFNPHPKPRQGQKPDETDTMVSEFTKRWNASETRRGGEPSSIGDVIKQGGEG